MAQSQSQPQSQRQTPETVTVVCLLAGAASRVLGSDAIAHNVTFKGPTKAQIQLRYKGDSKPNAAQIDQISALINAQIADKCAITVIPVSDDKSERKALAADVAKGLIASIDDPNLARVIIDQCPTGYTAIALNNDLSSLLAFRVIKCGFKKSKQLLDFFVEIGSGAQKYLRNLQSKNESKQVSIHKESLVLQYSHALVDDFIKQLQHSGALPPKDAISTELRAQLHQNAQHSLNQFQNVTYTRGLFAAKGKKVL